MIRNPYQDLKYQMCHWQAFDYSTLHMIRSIKRPGNQKNSLPVNDCYIMADTETSKACPNERDKDGKYIPVYNYVVAWTVSIRAYHQNLVTLYGHRPDTLVECLARIQKNLHAKRTYVFFHNLAYDWVFIRRFLMKEWGDPVKQLNTKPHYPVLIEFKNGVILRDSLILAQRKLEKWADDMGVEHKKAVGYWDYDRIRNQGDEFTKDELIYIEHDTLAGVEALDIMSDRIRKNIATLPYTATGIPREQMRKRGKPHEAHTRFLQIAPSAEEQQILEEVYHGGFTHGNRFFIGDVMENVSCYDFSSSYPYCLLAFKYPGSAFTYHGTCSVSEILENADTYAFFFKLALKNVDLKEITFPMPALQLSKCVKCINPITDNGRIVAADLVVIWMNETDLKVVSSIYNWSDSIVTDCRFTTKAYLPRWFTDFVYECYEQKSRGKGGDPVEYNLLKMRINSLYGMTCQKPCKPDIEEDYESGEFITQQINFNDKYEKYLNNHGSVLPFTAGVWCTSYAMYNLFQLGRCAGTWLYSDTDSCYGQDWDLKYLEVYNQICKARIEANGYDPVLIGDREYIPGVAEFDGSYSEFVTLGSKRYCGRSTKDGKLHITVAGVPKKGAEQLQDDIRNFKMGMIFKGEQSGKLMHCYMFNDKIETDKNGNLYADSIDLNPCDYLLDQTDRFTLEELLSDDITINTADEDI